MSARSQGGTRRGAGVLVFIILFCIELLSIASIARRWVASSQAGDGQAVIAGQRCEALAASAVAELEVRLRAALADARGPTARKVAAPVLGQSDGAIDLTASFPLEEAPALTRADPLRGYSISETSCRVAFQRSLDHLPYERIGVVVIRARAQAPWGLRRVARTVEETLPLCIALAGPPRPFDRFGLFVGEARDVTDLARVAPARETLLGLLDQTRERLTAALDELAGPAREQVLDILDELPDRARAARSTPELPASSDGAFLYGLDRDRARLALTHLDLAQRLDEGAGLARDALASLPAPQDPDFPARAGRLGRLVANALWSIWAFRESLVVLPAGGSVGRARLESFLPKIDESYLAGRALVRIEEGDTAVSADERLADFLRQGPFDGVIHVGGHRRPLHLSGTLRGRLMLVVGSGGVVMDGLGSGPSPSEHLTVAVFGGPVTIRGNCQAYVVAGADAPVIFEDGAVLTGGLAALRLAPGSRLAGTIVRSGRFAAGRSGPSGEEPDAARTFTLCLSPRPLARRVVR